MYIQLYCKHLLTYFMFCGAFEQVFYFLLYYNIKTMLLQNIKTILRKIKTIIKKI